MASLTADRGVHIGSADTHLRFNTQIAPGIAQDRWGKPLSQKGLSKRFAYFDDGDIFTVVAGPQEGEDVQRALALGLSYRKEHRLRLVLPETHLYATQMRLGWLKPGVVSLWSHDGRNAIKCRQRSRMALLASLADAGWPKPTPSLSRHTTTLRTLGEWLDSLGNVQPAHRQDYRAWQCRGRGVLRIGRRKNHVVVTAGVNSPDYEHKAFDFESAPTTAQMTEIKRLVCAAVDQRRGEEDGQHMEPEHWLQSVLRENPKHLKLAEPVIRELAAWRPRSEPTDAGKLWGRGFLDLVGLDSLGTIHLVETKIAPDDLLVLQGLDYYIWSQATDNNRRLRSRLDVDEQAKCVIDFVIGGSVAADGTVGDALVSRHTRAQVESVHEDVTWAFHTTSNWFPGPDLDIRTLDRGKVPKSVVGSVDG